MSIYGPNNDTPLVVEDLEGYAKQTYVDSQDEVSINEHNIDKRHKPVISIATEHTGALTNDAFQWSFGNGSQGNSFANCGYTMPSAGRALSMSLAVTGATGGVTTAATVKLVLNGLEKTGYTVTKLASEYSGTRTFGIPRELLEGDVINFRTKADTSDAAHAVLGTLIELDI